MLVTADRGFFSYELWRTYLLAGAQLLWRLTKTTHLPVLQILPDGSYLSEIKSFSGPGHTRIPIGKIADPMMATHIPGRVIEYQIDAGDGLTHLEVFRLITTILDPDQASAKSKRLGRMFSSWRRDCDHDPGSNHDYDRRPHWWRQLQIPTHPAPAPEPVFDTCEHGGRAGRAPWGILWCPSCRRQEGQVAGT